ncbi:Cold shock domain-containing protein E1 [Mytilus edulis]|uniref:Cold shock domain-containing protein E1 n=1 Tax=Mytilus edulis TaxID=6550 RepID=A0A8S3PPY6_MYTED|nr:Cold shock domain-containing protein E1 [Mytilus edulis]
MAAMLQCCAKFGPIDNFQPSTQDPAIVSFQRATAPVINSHISSNGSKEVDLGSGDLSMYFKHFETHSYGFIQCCERDSRLFFHFSEYGDDINLVKIGDPVEFQMTYDRRTGKPVASHIVLLNSGSQSYEVLSEEKFTGSIAQEAKPTKNKNGYALSEDSLGRVTYQHNGEVFFLPYGSDDVIDKTFKPIAQDQVQFYIATDKRNGNLHARQIEPVSCKVQGVVCSLKDSFGFIERADVVKEIFFHYSEYKGDINKLNLGDDVDFDVQNRNTKEVAVNIQSVPIGTVIFEDISVNKIQGSVQRTLKNSRRQSDPLGGRISYESAKGPVEIPFGDKDQGGDYTLLSGDVVECNIATDRRDKLQRATNIKLMEESFTANKENRETGVITNLKDGYGFIQCTEREARMFFHFITQDPSASNGNKLMAIRIKYLSKGSVSFLVIHPEKYIGTVDKEPNAHKSPGKIKEAETGIIVFDFDEKIQKISYTIKDVLEMKNAPRYGDKVEFNLGEVKSTKTRTGVNVRVVLRNLNNKCQGFIATLKDNYGFIENSDHEKEVFFHFSSYEGDPNDLDLGDEVEYTLCRKSAKHSAENIFKLPKGTIPTEEILRDKGQQQGKVLRPMRIVNPDQEEYCGLVQPFNVEVEDTEPEVYPYGITSLADKGISYRKGILAVNISAIRKFIRSKVDSVKGQFGFLNYEKEDGKKLFFHMTEVHDGVEIQTGDEVEFVVVQNQRNGKYSACSLRKITDRRRPERLVSRLKSVTEDLSSVRIVVIRQPKGPDGTKGFTQTRVPWTPPA